VFEVDGRVCKNLDMLGKYFPFGVVTETGHFVALMQGLAVRFYVRVRFFRKG
jgi:hypothetical protein